MVEITTYISISVRSQLSGSFGIIHFLINNLAHIELLDPVTGEVNATLDERTFRVGAEEDYVKIYFCGIHYLSDIPSDCWRFLTYLLQFVHFAEDPDSITFNYSLTVTLDNALRKQIAHNMKYFQGRRYAEVYRNDGR